MNAIISVVGKDNVGILAAVSTKLAELNISVLEISQTILGGNFTMIMTVGIENTDKTIAQLKEIFRSFGEEKGLSVNIQREDIFNAMHTI